MIIAIDGHSACGKSTLAKDLSRSLAIHYIDSGAMYRAATLYFLENHLNPGTDPQLDETLEKIQIDVVSGDHSAIILNGRDVSEAIRLPAVADAVSECSAIPAIRKRMVKLQRRLAQHKSVVMDGRDIGSVVFPQADFKFFITADLDIRIQRRQRELQLKGIQMSPEEVRANLIKRDHIDSTREDSPLVRTPDAYVIDNSHLNRHEQLQCALDIILHKKSI